MDIVSVTSPIGSTPAITTLPESDSVLGHDHLWAVLDMMHRELN